jgi:hypothetical protein
MSAGMSMRSRVSARRAVAAPGGAAGLAGSQMHPSAAHLLALFADAAFRLLDFMDRYQVGTGFFGHLGLLGVSRLFCEHTMYERNRYRSLADRRRYALDVA